MFAPGFPTLEGTVRQPNQEQVSIPGELALLLPGRCPLWSLLRPEPPGGVSHTKSEKKRQLGFQTGSFWGFGFLSLMLQSHFDPESGD